MFKFLRYCKLILQSHSLRHSEGFSPKESSLLNNPKAGLLRCNTPRNDVTNLVPSKKAAFTLAEVLITLGIIGVVAAMTLPTVIHKYQAKVLETGFKKSYANLQNAYIMTKHQLGVSRIRSAYATYDNVNKVYPYKREFYDAFYKQLKTVKIFDEYSTLNYRGNASTPAGCITSCAHLTRGLPDGSAVGSLINSSNIYLYVDTNGPLKGPNRAGFDVFAFFVDEQDKVMPIKGVSGSQASACDEEENSDACTDAYPCALKVTHYQNGMGCAWYAINNVSPDDETKTYWDNLPK